MTTENEVQVEHGWQFDPFHTQVDFSTKHLGMMTVRGHFTEVSATGELYPDNPEGSSVSVTIQSNSVRTNNEHRDNDLRTSNFLDTATYPTITFKSTKIETTGENHFNIIGDLTVKDVTKPVTLAAVNYGEFNDPRMGHRIGYSAEVKISRKDFGMSFNMLMDGKWVVGDDVQILIEGELIEK